MYSKVIQVYIIICITKYRLLQIIERNSLHYTDGYCWLIILYIVVCVC